MFVCAVLIVLRSIVCGCMDGCCGTFSDCSEMRGPGANRDVAARERCAERIRRSRVATTTALCRNWSVYLGYPVRFFLLTRSIQTRLFFLCNH